VSVDVAIRVSGERPGKPPLIRLRYDIAAANRGQETLWMVIPRSIPSGEGGVDKMELLRVGSVWVGKFLGTGGFYAVRLSPNAHLAISNLEVGWWSDDVIVKSPPPLEVRSVIDVALGGASIASWFGRDAAVVGNALIDMDTAQHTRSFRTDDGREVGVALVGAQKLVSSVPQ
jgi:hypothetical protein